MGIALILFDPSVPTLEFKILRHSPCHHDDDKDIYSFIFCRPMLKLSSSFLRLSTRLSGTANRKSSVIHVMRPRATLKRQNASYIIRIEIKYFILLPLSCFSLLTCSRKLNIEFYYCYYYFF